MIPGEEEGGLGEIGEGIKSKLIMMRTKSRIVESLYHTSETNITPYVNFSSI